MSCSLLVFVLCWWEQIAVSSAAYVYWLVLFFEASYKVRDSKNDYQLALGKCRQYFFLKEITVNFAFLPPLRRTK